MKKLLISLYVFMLFSNLIFSEEVFFEKRDYADWTLEENQDRITDNVWITRANNQGIFNISQESSYDYDFSPIDTEWCIGLSENYETNFYTEWVEAVEWNPPGMVYQTLSLHLIEDDLYFDVVFTSWTSGGEGGGFSYTRTLYQLPEIPTNVIIIKNGDNIDLSWEDMGAPSYNIYRSTDPYAEDWDDAIGSSDVNSYTDEGAASETKYFYYITSEN